MTYIKRITLKGFKSFAKETTIEFSKGFSCIVGANGSGKSNISDAILFVLGKLGSKGLRAESSSNLIYNGGKTGKPASEAMVELCLDNSDKSFPIQKQEVVITRIVRRNGGSIYKINGETKTRQEVLDLLSKAGISPYGFNIVLQDSISKFVEMKNENRRAIIEEIAGISMYEDKKKKSLRELEKTEERLKEINIILSERSNFLKQLEKERQQAFLYKKLERDIKILKTALILKQISKKEYEKKNLNKKVSIESKKLEEVGKEVEELQNKVSELLSELEKVTKRIELAVGKEQVEVRKDLMDIKGKVAMLEAKKKSLLDQIRNNVEREKQLADDIKKSERRLEEIIKKLKEKPKKLDFKSIGNRVIEDEKKLLRYVKDIIDKIRDIRTRKDVGKDELLNFLESIENSCIIINELIKKIKKNRDILSSPQRFELVRNLEVERGVLENEISKMKLLIKKSEEENYILKKEIEEVERDLKNISSDRRSIEELMTSFEKKFKSLFEKRNKIEKLLREKEREVKDKEAKKWQIESAIKQIEIEDARLDEDIKNLKLELEIYKEFEEEAKNVRKSETKLQEEIAKKQAKLEGLGDINLKALEIYDGAKKEYDEISEKANKLKDEKEEILNIIEEIDKKKRREFMKTFSRISENFSRIFSKLTEKGIGVLELDNKDNPFEEGSGVGIKIKLGKGKYLDTRGLSGGEKALTALAFIFAIQEYKPHHFYILDEVDSALDKRNSARLATLLKEYVKKAQYISISHNDAVINAADVLYGVSMQNGSSKVITLSL